jgi:hypothetical protein
MIVISKEIIFKTIVYKTKMDSMTKKPQTLILKDLIKRNTYFFL